VAPGPPIRVLLCDDHAVVREGLARLLARTDGIDVVGSAADVAEAVAAALALRPDVVLMDLAMPNVDGIAATRRITTEAPGSRVVVLTSFGDNARIHDALDAGALGYLLKDAEAAEVVRAIRAAARDESPLDPRIARAVLARGTMPAALSGMTAREREVLALLGTGLPNKVIARRLGISEATVKAHLTRVFRQLGVRDRTQAAIWAREHRVVAPQPPAR
jgi:DNA-binding NarL/FixJ family response regulator